MEKLGLGVSEVDWTTMFDFVCNHVTCVQVASIVTTAFMALREEGSPWTKREARAVPSAFVGEGTALCYAKGVSAATGRESSRETVGSWSQ